MSSITWIFICKKNKKQKKKPQAALRFGILCDLADCDLYLNLVTRKFQMQ